MPMLEINYLSIIVGPILSMVLGFLWYSPVLFGNIWMKLKGYKPEELKKEQSEMGKYYFVSFLASIVMAYMLSHVMALSMNFYAYSPVTTAFTTAIFMWVGFVFPVQLTATIFGNKNWQLLAIDTGYQLASLIVMAVVIGFLA